MIMIVLFIIFAGIALIASKTEDVASIALLLRLFLEYNKNAHTC
jgi:hypothetical protein